MNSIQVEGVSGRLFSLESIQLLANISGRESIAVPIWFSFLTSFSWYFFWRVRGSISNEDDLIDQFIFVDGLKKHLHSLIPCTSSWHHSL